MLRLYFRVCLFAILSFLFFSVSTAFAAKAYALVQVKTGESLSVIASRYSIYSDEIMAFNDLEDDRVQVGEVLKVPYLKTREVLNEKVMPPPPGFKVHKVQKGQTLSEVGQVYGISVEGLIGANTNLNSIDSVPQGLDLLIPPSAGLVVEVNDLEDIISAMKDFKVDSIRVAKANKIESPADIHEQKLIFLPDVRPIRALARLEFVRRQEALERAMEQRYTWPIEGQGRISEYYGRRAKYIHGAAMQHRGIDIAVPTGTPILAARAGRVTTARYDRVYGNIVKIKHFGGDTTWYAHASKLAVRVGDKVERGDVVAYVGATGLSTGPHLHFEIRSYGRAVDPLNFLEMN